VAAITAEVHLRIRPAYLASVTLDGHLRRLFGFGLPRTLIGFMGRRGFLFRIDGGPWMEYRNDKFPGARWSLWKKGRLFDLETGRPR
jgi:hypothetical protein